MKLGMQVLDGGPAPSPPKAHTAAQFSAHICCGQMAGWMKMPLGREIGLSPSNIVLDGDPAPLPPKVDGARQFLAHVYCGQTAGWMKMSLGTEVDLSPGHIVLNGDSAPSCERGTAASPLFTAHVCCDRGRPSHLLLSSFPVRSPHQQQHQVHVVLGRFVIFNQCLPVSQLNEMGQKLFTANIS